MAAFSAINSNLMPGQYHILNGDALRQQFPDQISGEIIVMRECLVDGPVHDTDLDNFLNLRAQFINENYGGNEEIYDEKARVEINKMLQIDDSADVNLWFEDDLFCQVNFWFVVHLFFEQKLTNRRLFLVRPKEFNSYGFGGLNQSELPAIYDNRIPLINLDKLAELWPAYQANNMQRLQELASSLASHFPFLINAVDAHIQRIPTDDNPGKPIESLIKIIDDLGTTEFGPVFKEFCKRESIYGFGDLQVKRIFDEIIKNQ